MQLTPLQGSDYLSVIQGLRTLLRYVLQPWLPSCHRYRGWWFAFLSWRWLAVRSRFAHPESDKAM